MCLKFRYYDAELELCILHANTTKISNLPQLLKWEKSFNTCSEVTNSVVCLIFVGH